MAEGKPVCVKCKKTESVYWTRAEDESVTCNDCFGVEPSNVEVQYDANACKITTRRSTRAGTLVTSSAKAKPSNNVPKKGKGRRAIFKKTCMKAPSEVATCVTRTSVYHQDQWFTIGDIVKVRGTDNKTYYCQLRGFLIDQYCNKSATITWLFPTTQSPPPEEGFDPATYIIGVDEDIPRSLDCFVFVMSAPSDYYKSDNTPYPPISCDILPSGKLEY